MRKIILGAIVLATLLSACNNTVKQKKSVVSEQKKTEIAGRYTCTMHPDVLKNKPGVCPKCGMELVEKDN